jgi:ABC-2 type transport system ATP-binding protein
MHEPQVLFLDEPSTGLDPAARLFVWDRLRELERRGVTLVLTTHDMHEAAELAHRVAIMDHGKLLAIDTPEALVHSLPGAATLELATASPDGRPIDDALAALRALPGVEALERVRADANGEPAARNDAELRIRLYVTGEAAIVVAPAATALGAHGLGLSDVKLGSPSLEDVFIHLTGRALR